MKKKKLKKSKIIFVVILISGLIALIVYLTTKHSHSPSHTPSCDSTACLNNGICTSNKDCLSFTPHSGCAACDSTACLNNGICTSKEHCLSCTPHSGCAACDSTACLNKGICTSKEGCSSCTPHSGCAECMPTYPNLVRSDNCLESDGICHPVVEQGSLNPKCKVCESDYSVETGQLFCLSKSPNSEIGTCISQPGCASCAPGGKCAACHDQTQWHNQTFCLNKGICTSKEGCLSCTPDGKGCAKCNGGYCLEKDGICNPVCTSAAIVSCKDVGQTLNPNCKVCPQAQGSGSWPLFCPSSSPSPTTCISQSLACTSCAPGGKCAVCGVNPRTGPTCLNKGTCTSKNGCSSCTIDGNGCASCAPSYNLKDGICEKS